MNQKRVNRSYSQAFNEEAVALVTQQDYSVPEAAKSLGIRTNRLYDWKAKYEVRQRDSDLSSDERVELQRLRKENKRLLMEKEILKRASAFFAKEMK